MRALKLRYQNLETPLKVVYRKPIVNKKGVQSCLSVDPLQFEYPQLCSYQYAGNKPITFIDLDGLEEAKKEDEDKKQTSGEKNINSNSCFFELEPARQDRILDRHTLTNRATKNNTIEIKKPNKNHDVNIGSQNIWDASGVWFNVSIDWNFWGAGVEGQLGPLKGGAAISIANVEGKVDDCKLLLTAKENVANIGVKGTLGNVKLSGSITNVIDGSTSGSLAEGSAVYNNDGLKIDGKLIAGSIEASNNTSNSSYKKSGSVLPYESKTELKNMPVEGDVNYLNMEIKLKTGPVKINIGGNPVIAGAKGSILIDSYAKQATGQAPPMPIFILFKAIFGSGS